MLLLSLPQIACLLLSIPIIVHGQIDTYEPGPGWQLAWSEEFDGPFLDLNTWMYELGNGVNGWGNQELEQYTHDASNIRVLNGTLMITARKQGDTYTSARIKTQGLKSFSYGRIAARIQAPIGQGMWPAFWMLGDSINQVSWPRCGEIDIFEMVGGGPGKDCYSNTAYFSTHWANSDGSWAQYSLPGNIPYRPNASLSSGFHVYEVEWSHSSIIGKIDNIAFFKMNTGNIDAFVNKTFFLLLNLAVGGYWPGSPDSSTVFPQTMYVDWVRHYTATPSLNSAYLVSLPGSIPSHGTVPILINYSINTPLLSPSSSSSSSLSSSTQITIVAQLISATNSTWVVAQGQSSVTATAAASASGQVFVYMRYLERLSDTSGKFVLRIMSLIPLKSSSSSSATHAASSSSSSSSSSTQVDELVLTSSEYFVSLNDDEVSVFASNLYGCHPPSPACFKLVYSH